LDDAVGLTDTGADTLADARTGKNGRHLLGGLLRQSVFGRLAGYEDVNDADRLCRDPAMRWVVGDRAITGCAASASQMGRFETEWLARPENLAALADLPGLWIEKVHTRRPPRVIVLDMDSSESPTYGTQEGSAYNPPVRPARFYRASAPNLAHHRARCRGPRFSCSDRKVGGRVAAGITRSPACQEASLHDPLLPFVAGV